MSKIQIKKRKTHELRFTKFELLHLRDMLGVVLPPNTNKTLSQHLAELENRVLIESALWNKISSACSEAGLPVGDEAPDYIVAPISSPAMSVFQLASEPAEDVSEQGSAGFVHDSAGDE
jgi:hypothetical protein